MYENIFILIIQNFFLSEEEKQCFIHDNHNHLYEVKPILTKGLNVTAWPPPPYILGSPTALQMQCYLYVAWHGLRTHDGSPNSYPKPK